MLIVMYLRFVECYTVRAAGNSSAAGSAVSSMAMRCSAKLRTRLYVSINISEYWLARLSPSANGGVRISVCEALGDLSTAADVACDERPPRWASRYVIVTQFPA